MPALSSTNFAILCLEALSLIWLFLLLSKPAPTCAVPCGPGWIYDSAIGWCLKHVVTPLNWTDARAYCASLNGPAAGARATPSRLGAPYNQTAASAANRFLTKLANFGDMWVGAIRVDSVGAYQWADHSPPRNVSTGWGTNPGTKECVYMAAVNMVDGTDWKTGIELDTSNCSVLKQFFCFYDSKRCNFGDLVGYNAQSMDLQLQAANIGEVTTAYCRAGFYRRSQMMAAMMGIVQTTPASAHASPTPNSVNCSDSSVSSDPELASPAWVQGTIEECLKVGCSTDSLLDLGIENALPFADALVKSTYLFGESFNVTCKQGYVSTTNVTSKVAQVTCMQDPVMTWLGMWMPSSSDVCGPIQCVDVRSVLANYSNVEPIKAYNKEINKWYSDLEVNKFSSYSTEVYITCKEVGLFFQDQKYERQLACQVENETSTTANWVGIRGTFMISGYIQNILCIEVVCNLVDLFHLMEEGGSVQDLLTSYHINEGITVYDASTHALTNYSRNQVSSLGSLRYGSYISVSCPPERLFVQSGTDQDNLVLNLVQMGVTCSKTGKWNQTLGMCIEKTAAIQLLGRQKQYVPEAKEAGAAWQMGTVTISIVIVFFTCIVILDLATIKRDINLLKTNLFYLKLRLTHF